MFEFDQYDKRLHLDAADPGETTYEPITDIARMSFLRWGEHCIECAAPDCYATCDLYRSRRDGNCRRFAYGVYRNRRFRSLRGYGAEVSFKTWGRLKANGNTRMEPVGALLWKERLVRIGVPLANGLGAFLSRVTRDRRLRTLAPDFDNVARRWHRRNDARHKPDLFLIEVINPQPHPVIGQLTMRVGEDFLADHPDPGSFPPPFTISLRLDPGYSRHEVERGLFAAITESGVPFKLTFVPQGEDAVKLVFLTLDFVTLRRPAGGDRRAAAIKCVVFDLDNTLWRGVLVEGDDVRIADGVVRLIRELDRRGILVSIASKNDHEPAWRKIEDAGLSEYFLHPQIGWRPKSESIARIADALDIGLDTFAFIDDNPFELDEVSRHLPEVTCLHADALGGLLDRPRFEGGTSEEANNRRRYYREATARAADRSKFKNDYRGFLTSCETRLHIETYREADFDRVAELAQRTNQLNFSGTKYTRAAIAALLADPDLETYVLRCSDRYGCYGTVGLALVRRRPSELRIEEFMLSCRVQGRLIEQAFLSHLLEHPSRNGVARLSVNFRPTPRNGPARQILEDLNFRPDGNGGGLSLDVRAYPLVRDAVEVVAPRRAEAVSSAGRRSTGPV